MTQTVMVVDDSPMIRRVVSRTLEQVGYQVHVAANGQEALATLQEAAPDLILLDFVMPLMNGFQFCRALRNIQGSADTPIVLMSAKADRIGARFIAETGALNTLSKPFTPSALLSITAEALAKISTPEEPPPSEHAHASDRTLITAAPKPLREDVDIHAAFHSAASKIASQIAELVQSMPHQPKLELARVRRAILKELPPHALFEWVEKLQTNVPGGEGEKTFTGELQHIGLGDVLQLLQHQRQSGILHVFRNREDGCERYIRICLKNGFVELVLAQLNTDAFQLGKYVLRRGSMSESELAAAIAARPEKPHRPLLGIHLRRQGHLTEQTLREILTQQSSELIYEALRWKRGTFEFQRFASRPEAREADLSLPLGSILMEGLRRVDEWRLIEEKIKSLKAIPSVAPDAGHYLALHPLDTPEQRLFNAIDGRRNIYALVEASHLSTFDACRILFRFLNSRVIRFDTQTHEATA